MTFDDMVNILKSQPSVKGIKVEIRSEFWSRASLKRSRELAEPCAPEPVPDTGVWGPGA